MKEGNLMRMIQRELNLTGRVRLLRNSVGFDVANNVKYGQPGSPDLWGVLRNGHCFAIEVKSDDGRVSPEQQAWWIAARKWGVLGGVAKSVAEAMALLNEATNS